MDNYGITAQSVLSSLQLMLTAVSLFLGLYVLLDHYFSFKKITVEKNRAMQTIGFMLIVVTLYRLFFLVTNLRVIMPQAALMVTIIYYYVIYRFMMISLYKLVGLEDKAPQLEAIFVRWILMNAVIFIVPITIFPFALDYVLITVILMFFSIEMPQTLKRWNTCRKHIISTIPKEDPERKLLMSILASVLLLIIWPINGILLSYFVADWTPIHFVATTIMYIWLIIQYKNYFVYIITQKEE